MQYGLQMGGTQGNPPMTRPVCPGPVANFGHRQSCTLAYWVVISHSCKPIANAMSLFSLPFQRGGVGSLCGLDLAIFV